jgi:uncharacterized metal-binding protein YceD (DUF177 family)
MQRKHLYYVAQEGEKEKKEQFIQQQATSTKKKPPPMAPVTTTTHDMSDFKWQDMTAELLKVAIPAQMATWSEEKMEETKKNCQKTAYIVTLMEYIYYQLPSTYCEGTKLGGCERRVKWYKKHFPHGVVLFTVPVHCSRSLFPFTVPVHCSLNWKRGR